MFILLINWFHTGCTNIIHINIKMLQSRWSHVVPYLDNRRLAMQLHILALYTFYTLLSHLLGLVEINNVFIQPLEEHAELNSSGYNDNGCKCYIDIMRIHIATSTACVCVCVCICNSRCLQPVGMREVCEWDSRKWCQIFSRRFRHLCSPLTPPPRYL